MEWVTVVPLPTHKEPEQFTLSFELEVPAHLMVAHNHWQSLQILSRLQSPLERNDGTVRGSAAESADGLRELALAVAHRTKTQRQHFTRECFLANSLLALDP